MNTKIYVVISDNGEYECRSIYNIVAVHSKERAEEIASLLKELGQYNKTFDQQLTEAVIQYHNEQPKLEAPKKPPYAFKQLPPNTTFTAEEWDRYKQLQADHLKQVEEYEELSIEFEEQLKVQNEKGNQFMREYISTNYQPPAHLLNIPGVANPLYISSEVVYSVEELELEVSVENNSVKECPCYKLIEDMAWKRQEEVFPTTTIHQPDCPQCNGTGKYK